MSSYQQNVKKLNKIVTKEIKENEMKWSNWKVNLKELKEEEKNISLMQSWSLILSLNTD